MSIYAAILAAIWALRLVGTVQEIERNRVQSSLPTEIVAHAMLIPIFGRVWGWW